MIIGGLTDIEEFAKVDEPTRNAALDAALDQFRVNPVIDKEVRSNPVIMRELAKTVSYAISPASEVTKQEIKAVRELAAKERPRG